MESNTSFELLLANTRLVNISTRIKNSEQNPIKKEDKDTFVSLCQSNMMDMFIPNFIEYKVNSKKIYTKEFVEIINALMISGQSEDSNTAKEMLDACFNQLLSKSNTTLIEEFISAGHIDEVISLINTCKFANFYSLLHKYFGSRQNTFNIIEKLFIFNKFNDIIKIINCLLENGKGEEYNNEKINILVKMTDHKSVNGTLREFCSNRINFLEKNKNEKNTELIKQIEEINYKLTFLDFLFEFKFALMAIADQKSIKSLRDTVIKPLLDKIKHHQSLLSDISKITDKNLFDSMLIEYFERLSQDHSTLSLEISSKIVTEYLDKLNDKTRLINTEILINLIQNLHNETLDFIFKIDNKEVKSLLSSVSIDDLLAVAVNVSNIHFLKLIEDSFEPISLCPAIDQIKNNKKLITYLFDRFAILPEINSISDFSLLLKVILESKDDKLINKLWQYMDEMDPEFLRKNINFILETAIIDVVESRIGDLLSRPQILNDYPGDIHKITRAVLIRYLANKDLQEVVNSFMSAIDTITNVEVKQKFYAEFLNTYVYDKNLFVLALAHSNLQIIDLYLKVQKEFPDLNVFTTTNNQSENVLHVLTKNEDMECFTEIVEKLQTFLSNSESKKVLIKLFSQNDLNGKDVSQIFSSATIPNRNVITLSEEYNINHIILNAIKGSDDVNAIKDLMQEPYVSLNYTEAMYYILKYNRIEIYNFFINLDNFYDLFCKPTISINYYMRKMLPCAYKYEKDEIVNILILNSKKDNNLLNGTLDNQTTFEMACEKNDFKTIQILLENGFDVFNLNLKRTVCFPLLYVFTIAKFDHKSHLNLIVSHLNKKLNNISDSALIPAWAFTLRSAYPLVSKKQMYTLIEHLLLELQFPKLEDYILFLKEIYFFDKEIYSSSNLLTVACEAVAKKEVADDAIFAVIKLLELKPELIPDFKNINQNQNKLKRGRNKSKNKVIKATSNPLTPLLEAGEIELAKEIVVTIQKSNFYLNVEENNKIIQTILSYFSEIQSNIPEFTDFLQNEIKRYDENFQIFKAYKEYLNDHKLITIEVLEKFDRDNKSLLHYALKNNKQEVLAKILSFNNNNQFFLVRDNQKQTALFYARDNEIVIKKYKNIIKDEIKNNGNNLAYLLDDFRSCHVDLSEKDIVRFLFIACEKGNHEAMRCLFDYIDHQDVDININQTNVDEFTLLNLACSYGHLKIVELLMDRGALCYPITLKIEQLDALHIAISEDHVEIIDCLLKHMDATLVQHIVFNAIRRSDIKVFDYIINNKIITDKYNVLEFSDHESNSLLHLACQYNRINIVRKLIPGLHNKPNRSSVTPLELACASHNDKIVELLLASPNVDIFKTSVLKKIEDYPLNILKLLSHKIGDASHLTNNIQKQQAVNLEKLIRDRVDAEKINDSRQQKKLDKKQVSTAAKPVENGKLFRSKNKGWHNERIPFTDVILADGADIEYYSVISAKLISELDTLQMKKFQEAQKSYVLRKKGKNGVKPLTSTYGLKFKDIFLLDQDGKPLLDSKGKEIKFRTNDFYELKINSDERLWGVKINTKDQPPLIYFIDYLPKGFHTQGSVNNFNSIKSVSLKIGNQNVAKNELTYNN